MFNFRQAFTLTLPVLSGYIAIGIPFGLMVTQAHFPWWLAAVMSLFIYSGTGQYIAIAYFASGLASESTFLTFLLTLLGIEFFVSLRHSFYGISLLDKFKDTGRWKPLLIYELTDETFALFCSTEAPAGVSKGAFYGTISLLNHSYWLLGTTLGAVAGQFVPEGYLEGVDFALTCLFAVLMINQIRQTKDWLPSVLGIASTLVAAALAYIPAGPDAAGNPAYILPHQNIILAGLVLGIAVIVLVRGFIQKEIKNFRAEGETK